MPSYQHTIHHLKIRRSHERLIFILEIYIPEKTAFILKQVLSSLSSEILGMLKQHMISKNTVLPRYKGHFNMRKSAGCSFICFNVCQFVAMDYKTGVLKQVFYYQFLCKFFSSVHIFRYIQLFGTPK